MSSSKSSTTDHTRASGETRLLPITQLTKLLCLNHTTSYSSRNLPTLRKPTRPWLRRPLCSSLPHDRSKTSADRPHHLHPHPIRPHASALHHLTDHREAALHCPHCTRPRLLARTVQTRRSTPTTTKTTTHTRSRHQQSRHQ
jgi:hypothetical protein